MFERVQYDVTANDIIAEAILACSDSPLTFANRYISELLDIVALASVVRIVKEDSFEWFELAKEVSVSFENLLEIALEAG
jgi:hypothetical protein